MIRPPARLIPGTSSWRGTAAPLLSATILFAALLSVHTAVAHCAFALGRKGIITPAFGGMNANPGPAHCRLDFAVGAGAFGRRYLRPRRVDSVLMPPTWLAYLGTLGVLVPMRVTSFAGVSYFRRHPQQEPGRWASVAAPTTASVLLLIVIVLGVANFNALITGAIGAAANAMATVLPATVFGGGTVGLMVGAVLRYRRSDAYRRLGEGAEARDS